MSIFLGSFATATCQNCLRHVDSEVIKEDIMQQRIPICGACDPSGRSRVKFENIGYESSRKLSLSPSSSGKEEECSTVSPDSTMPVDADSSSSSLSRNHPKPSKKDSGGGHHHSHHPKDSCSSCTVSNEGNSQITLFLFLFCLRLFIIFLIIYYYY